MAIKGCLVFLVKLKQHWKRKSREHNEAGVIRQLKTALCHGSITIMSHGERNLQKYHLDSLFSKHLLSTSYVPDTVLGPGDTKVNEALYEYS